MLFILNKSLEVVDTLSNVGELGSIAPIFEDEYVQDLATGSETYTFKTMANSRQSQHLTVGNYIAFLYKKQYKLFNIIQIDEEHNEEFVKTVYCEMSGIELINEIVRPMNVVNTNAKSFLQTILQDTSWSVGIVELGTNDLFDYEITDYNTVYGLIQEVLVGIYGLEVSFTVEIKNNKIVNKFVNIFKERGRNEGFRFSYSSNLSSIVRTVDTSTLCTALIGVGNSDLTFRDIETSDKPLGQDFITNEDAYKVWSKNGKHILGVFKAETDSAQELLKLTREELVKRSEPQVKYELSVETLGKDEISIGDTVYIVDHEFNPPIRLTGRVSELRISFSDSSSNQCVLSNFKEVSSNITRDLQEMIESKFPIGSGDIQDGAITGEKLQEGQIIKGTHLFANSISADKIQADSISTEHLQANSITSDKLSTGELITSSAQIGDAIIDSAHLKNGIIDTVKINDAAITSSKIGDAQIGTAHIKDLEVTVAKIQNAFIDDLVATQGKFQSAHIGVLTSNNIDTNTIKAEHISTNVIDAINMNVNGKIQANRIDVDSLKVNSIDASAIVSGTIDANRITGSVVQAINGSFEDATINAAKIGSLDASKITTGSLDADIIKGSVINAINMSVSGKIKADRIDVESLKVNSIDASAIVSGTVDADRLTGSVVQAITLSSDKIDAKNINVDGLKVGGANILEGSITSATIGKGQINNAHINSAFVADAYIRNLNASVITSGQLDTSKINVSSISGNLNISNNTIQIKDTKNVVRVQLGEDSTKDYGLIIRNGNGETMWDFTGATSKGIQDDAITTNKIKDEQITSNKLVMDEIWASEGFISNFKAQSIDANQITTGKITGEYLDITGLINFDALDSSISQNFTPSRDESGNITKTWINGATIYTGSVSADKINTRGLSAVNTLGETTFNIDEDTGNVTMSGLVKSSNYSDVRGQETGYLLTPDGNAYLNDTIVRGSVMLPSSGITQEGSANLIPFTDFSIDVKDNYSTYGKNFVVTVDTSQKIMSVVNNTLDVAEDGGLVTPKITGGLKANNKYTLSFKAMNTYHVGNLDYIYVITNKTGVSNKKLDTVEVNTIGSWDKTQHITFTVAEDLPNAQILIGFRDIVIPSGGNKKGFQLKELRLTEGDEPSMWFEESPVRFYAGSDFDNRNQAPFRVLEDGSVIATKGNFGGTITGKLRIGNIYIEDTNTTEGCIDIKNNDESETLVHLEENNSYIKSDLNIGDFVNFDTTDKNIEVTKGNVAFTGNNSKYIKFPNSTGVVFETGYTSSTYGQYKHEIWYNQGSLWNNAFGNKKDGVADFIFCRDRGETQSSVEVKGELKVTDKITMNNNIAIVARQEVGNSGFDYVVR